LGFLAAWVGFFILFLRGLSLKAPVEPHAGMVFTFNTGSKHRLFGFVFLAVSSTVGWVVLVEPLVAGKERFQPGLLFPFALMLLFLTIGAAMLFRINVIRLEAGSHRYLHQTVFFPFHKEHRGELGDISSLQIKQEVVIDHEDRSTQRYWTLNLIWKDATRAKLELTQRPRGFSDLGKDPLNELTRIGSDISAKTGIPLTIEPPAT
jgi:hypothetical protein